MTEPKNELFFVVRKSEESGPVSLVRVKTPVGAPHIAFTNPQLGQAYLTAKKASGTCSLVPESQVTKDMPFDFSSGLLILDSLEDIAHMLRDPNTTLRKEAIICL